MIRGGLGEVSLRRRAFKLYLNDENESCYRAAVPREKAQLVQKKTRRQQLGECLCGPGRMPG